MRAILMQRLSKSNLPVHRKHLLFRMGRTDFHVLRRMFNKILYVAFKLKKNNKT